MLATQRVAKAPGDLLEPAVDEFLDADLLQGDAAAPPDLGLAPSPITRLV